MRRGGRLHGVLIVDKPAGLTSHDVVARVRRLTGEARVGHAGTLDPAATGVLPLCVGVATRLVEYLSDADKTYLAEVVLGIQTDTDDLEGAIVASAPLPPLPPAAIDDALRRFRGPLQQTPPAYAAVKVGGRRLYELARAGTPVVAPPRAVTIHRLDRLAWQPPALTLLVACSKGTYIRSLARDLGAALGCGGYVQSLRRVWTGPFCLADAWPLVALTERDLIRDWPDVALPLDAFLRHWPVLALDVDAARRWRQGQPVAGPPAAGHMLARVYGPADTFLGTARYDVDAGFWRPDKVLALAEG